MIRKTQTPRTLYAHEPNNEKPIKDDGNAKPASGQSWNDISSKKKESNSSPESQWRWRQVVLHCPGFHGID